VNAGDRPPDLDTETVVVGASSAGLAVAAQLRLRGRAFEILEAEDQVAGAWRRHYERLHLHTPKSVSSLPGLPMPREWPRYVSRVQVVEYLERYRAHFDLQPHHGERVVRIERTDGAWVTTTVTRTWRSAHVVIATGRTRVPVVPTWPGRERYGGDVLHSGAYVDGAPYAGKRVLVVGFGNSACEQALDLAEHGAEAHLSVRSPVNVLPRDVFGRIPVVRLAVLMAPLPPAVADALARPVMRAVVGDLGDVGLRRLPYGPITQIRREQRVPLLDIGPLDAMRDGRIAVHGDVARFTDDGVAFTDGSELAVAAVVLATGYRAAVGDVLVGWESVCDADGTPRCSGGPTGVDGLWFCGMRIAPTGMFREIGRDARAIARLIGSSSA
jgi:cation diffusion facilitator CzcD-associated flavoprotein CzcO